MNWHLYKKDDLRTWPEIDCPMLVYYIYDNGHKRLFLCKWNVEHNSFINYKHDEWIKEILPPMQECYYKYIGYVPDGYKTHSPTLCDNEGHNSHLCDEYDNGYCMDRGYHIDCPYKIKWNEYEIETKRIWKEFE